MNAYRLYEILSTLDAGAKVFVETDHGGVPESAHNILVTFDDEELVHTSYYGEDLTWVTLESVLPSTYLDITGVLISA